MVALDIKHEVTHAYPPSQNITAIMPPRLVFRRRSVLLLLP